MRLNEQAEMARQKKSGIKWIVFISLAVIAYFGYIIVVQNNTLGHYIMIEPLSGQGHLTPVMEPGRVFKWFNKTYVWDRSNTYWFSHDPTEGSKNDESVTVRYNDGGTANISGSVRYTIDYDETNELTKQKSKGQFVQLHVQYRTQENFVDRAIRSLVTEVLTLTSTLMSAEESYTTDKARFTQLALDQLNHGVYLVNTVEKNEKTVTGEVKTIRKSTLKLDSKGNPMRKEYALKDYDIKFTQFVISDPEYHASIITQISGKLNNLMGKVASEAEAELKKAQEETAIYEGQRNVEKSEYMQKVINTTDILQSEIDAARQTIPAEARNIVSSLEKQAAEAQRDANILLGEGEASYKQALQQADNNMDVRLKLWLAGHLARAAIIAKNGTIMPEWIMPDANAADTGMNILNYQAMKPQLSPSVNKTK